MKRAGLVMAWSLVFGLSLRAEDHIWSKQGTELFLVSGNEGIGHIEPLRVASPDGHKRIQIDFKPGPEGDSIPIATLVEGGRKIPIALDKDWTQVEVLWSADSTSVALSGTFNAYTNS